MKRFLSLCVLLVLVSSVRGQTSYPPYPDETPTKSFFDFLDVPFSGGKHYLLHPNFENQGLDLTVNGDAGNNSVLDSIDVKPFQYSIDSGNYFLAYFSDSLFTDSLPDDTFSVYIGPVYVRLGIISNSPLAQFYDSCLAHDYRVRINNSYNTRFWNYKFDIIQDTVKAGRNLGIRVSKSQNEERLFYTGDTVLIQKSLVYLPFSDTIIPYDPNPHHPDSAVPIVRAHPLVATEYTDISDWFNGPKNISIVNAGDSILSYESPITNPFTTVAGVPIVDTIKVAKLDISSRSQKRGTQTEPYIKINPDTITNDGFFIKYKSILDSTSFKGANGPSPFQTLSDNQALKDSIGLVVLHINSTGDTLLNNTGFNLTVVPPIEGATVTIIKPDTTYLLVISMDESQNYMGQDTLSLTTETPNTWDQSNKSQSLQFRLKNLDHSRLEYSASYFTGLDTLYMVKTSYNDSIADSIRYEDHPEWFDVVTNFTKLYSYGQGSSRVELSPVRPKHVRNGDSIIVTYFVDTTTINGVLDEGEPFITSDSIRKVSNFYWGDPSDEESYGESYTGSVSLYAADLYVVWQQFASNWWGIVPIYNRNYTPTPIVNAPAYLRSVFASLGVRTLISPQPVSSTGWTVVDDSEIAATLENYGIVPPKNVVLGSDGDALVEIATTGDSLRINAQGTEENSTTGNYYNIVVYNTNLTDTYDPTISYAYEKHFENSLTLAVTSGYYYLTEPSIVPPYVVLIDTIHEDEYALIYKDINNVGSVYLHYDSLSFHDSIKVNLSVYKEFTINGKELPSRYTANEAKIQIENTRKALGHLNTKDTIVSALESDDHVIPFRVAGEYAITYRYIGYGEFIGVGGTALPMDSIPKLLAAAESLMKSSTDIEQVQGSKEFRLEEGALIYNFLGQVVYIYKEGLRVESGVYFVKVGNNIYKVDSRTINNW